MEIGGEHRLGAGDPRELDQQEADGPTAQHGDHVRDARRRQIHRVQRHAERLEQRPRRVAHGGRQRVEEMRGVDQPLAQGAGNARRAHEADARADMGMAVDAELAFAAGDGGIDGHAVARAHPDHPRPHRLHHAGELVAHHEAALERVRRLAAIVVEVGAADATAVTRTRASPGPGARASGTEVTSSARGPIEGKGLHRSPAAGGQRRRPERSRGSPAIASSAATRSPRAARAPASASRPSLKWADSR